MVGAGRLAGCPGSEGQRDGQWVIVRQGRLPETEAAGQKSRKAKTETGQRLAGSGSGGQVENSRKVLHAECERTIW